MTEKQIRLMYRDMDVHEKVHRLEIVGRYYLGLLEIEETEKALMSDAVKSFSEIKEIVEGDVEKTEPSEADTFRELLKQRVEISKNKERQLIRDGLLTAFGDMEKEFVIRLRRSIRQYAQPLSRIEIEELLTDLGLKQYSLNTSDECIVVKNPMVNNNE